MTEAAPPATARSVRAASLVAGGIFVSRIIGFVRDRAFAHFFGSAAAADAFNAASKIPNILRNLLGEGALSASFIPVYSAALERANRDEARALANSILAILLLATSVVTIAGIALAPIITEVVATGFDGEKAALTTRLIRVLFPMTGLMVLSGWCLGIQNSHRLFFTSYASAALWSLAQIVLLVWWGPQADTLEQLAWWLAWATIAGALLQIGAQLPQVLPLVWPLALRIRWSPPVRETLRNFVPVVTALGLFQISSLIDLQIASWLPDGSVANLGYAQRIYLLPISLFGISVAAAALPEFSRESAAVARDALTERLRDGWVRILFYIVPTAVAFVLLGDVIVGLLYRSGRFGADEQRLVHFILAAYAIGLMGFSSVKLVASAFYAMQDYRTPLRAALASILVGASISILVAVLFRQSPYAAAGLAVGASLGSYVNLGILAATLRRRLGTLYTPAMWKGTWRTVGSSLLAGVVAYPVRWLLRDEHVAIAALATLPLFGVVFLAAAHHAGSGEAARLLRRMHLLRR